MSKQTYKEIVAGYDREDPWNMKTNPCDIERKKRILKNIEHYLPLENITDQNTGKLIQRKTKFSRALDLCCGEAWITTDLPAKEIHGYELSDKAAARFPANVKRVNPPIGRYDLVVLTGALYKHYEWEKFVKLINEHASSYIFISNIKEWEVKEAVEGIKAMRLTWFSFPYRQYEQMFRVYRV